MATKQRADKQKEKEKKEKVILAALVGVLVIVGALELPKMLKGSPAATAAQTTSTSPGTTPSGIAASGPITAGSLPNASPYKPGVGQLSALSLFNGQDPFGKSATTTSSGATTPGATTPGATTPPVTTTNQRTNTTRSSYVAANISVNGTSQTVLLKGTFPSSSPAFILYSVAAKQIKITVNGGSFASGQPKVTINKGGSKVLVNTVDSMRYVIKYIAPLTAGQALSLIGTTAKTGTTSGTTSNSTTTGSTTTTG
jgi:hypothetical protein